MNHNSLLREEEGERKERERGRGWTNLLTLELIEQNESCTEMKRDCKGKESLTRSEQRGDETERAGRVGRGETGWEGGGRQDKEVEIREHVCGIGMGERMGGREH